MLQEGGKAPPNWAEDLARADEDIAAGRTFAADELLEEMRMQLAELEAEMEAEPDSEAAKAPSR